MGILHTPVNVGVVPECTDMLECSPDDIICNAATFKNYPDAENQAIIGGESEKHIEKDHLAAFDTFQQLTGFVEGTPPQTPISNNIIKKRNGITKARSILDTKQSGVKRMTAKSERVTLPRLFDAILRLLFLLAAVCTPDALVNAFVLDFFDAYWQIPLREDERKYFCATAKIIGKRKYLAFLQAAQGSTNAGRLWGRLAALTMRLTQSLYSPSELSLMCYADDPLAALHATERVRRHSAAFMVLVWEALGFKLAYAVGQVSNEVTWVGDAIRSEPEGVRAWIKEALVSDIKADLEQFMSSNVISNKDLSASWDTQQASSLSCDPSLTPCGLLYMQPTTMLPHRTRYGPSKLLSHYVGSRHSSARVLRG